MSIEENTWWSSFKAYASNPIAAAVSITPVYGLMAKKSALQLEQEPKQLSLGEKVKGGMKLAPVVGTIVGTQMGLQKVVEKALDPDEKEQTLLKTLKSAAIVGALSAPTLVVFNGLTMDKGLLESLRGLKSPKVTGAIALQETAFVGGLSVAGNVVEVLKKWLGDNQAVESSGSFISGSAGALAGHPANTALTRWQNGLTVHTVHLMRGAPQRALGTGIFALIYNLSKKTINTE